MIGFMSYKMTRPIVMVYHFQNFINDLSLNCPELKCAGMKENLLMFNSFL